jgi:hypothetical protein
MSQPARIVNGLLGPKESKALPVATTKITRPSVPHNSIIFVILPLMFLFIFLLYHPLITKYCAALRTVRPEKRKTVNHE